jgi:hypothetical protein
VRAVPRASCCALAAAMEWCDRWGLVF